MSDDIRSRPATREYRDGWERTFGSKRRVAEAIEVVRQRLGLGPHDPVPANEVAKVVFSQPVEPEDAGP